jgi:thymidylate synthase ThyX
MTISVKIIADSISEAGKRLTTAQWRYPKFIHGEVMTHRVFSRNASSSRAIPVERLIKDVIDDPVYPSFWGKNQPGMSAAEECTTVLQPSGMEDIDHTREQAWDAARQAAIYWARGFSKAGYHKQIVNRLLEPFCHINVVVTATEWGNFFVLRCHKDAQPEIRILAETMRTAMEISQPKLLRRGQWHLPYVDVSEEGSGDPSPETWRTAVQLSVARCARVSYLTQDGRVPDGELDLKLYERLVGAVPLHASPAEHQATPDFYNLPSWLNDDPKPRPTWKQRHLHGNFCGWIQFRKTLPGESQ